MCKPLAAAVSITAFLALAGAGAAVAQTIPGAVAPVPELAAPAAPAVKPAPAARPAARPAPKPAAAAPVQAQAPAAETPAAAPGAEPPPAPAATPPPPRVVKKQAPPPAPRETALPDNPEPSYGPETFFTTAKASERYAAIADAGGWPTVASLAPGAKGKPVETLRQRLAMEGDLDAAKATGEVYDADVKAAVQRFQLRHGLKRNGVVAGATLKAMNVPAATRFRQLASSAQRLAGYTFSFGDRYIVVNIPSASIETVANGQIARRFVAVVGDVKHPSPEVEAKIGAVNLNPTWTVPTSIIKNEIIPKMRRDPGYLSRAKIRVLDSAGNVVEPSRVNWQTEHAASFTLRQDSGAGNALGSIRIAMPNKHAVYMHDTPSKRFFGMDYRFHSHGCVRVEGVYDLAQWVLEGTRGGWDKATILARIGTGDRLDIRVPQPVPVAWVYLTGWATPDGTAHFRNDVYGLDSIGVAQVATR
ncbi:MAG: L,D-transpeptidase family protein [Methylobacteriaceae bacterium]|nr:L,D-transpeptidase family protein [Methylobacteriaceae bacterium]